VRRVGQPSRLNFRTAGGSPFEIEFSDGEAVAVAFAGRRVAALLSFRVADPSQAEGRMILKQTCPSAHPLFE
jgi:hypothetical protein